MLSSFSFLLECNDAILFMTDEYIEKYDRSVSNISERISQKIHHLSDIGYDFELQTVYYILDSKHLYSISMITKERKV